MKTIPRLFLAVSAVLGGALFSPGSLRAQDDAFTSGGTIILAGGNTYSGSTSVNDGTLDLGTAGVGAVTVSWTGANPDGAAIWLGGTISGSTLSLTNHNAARVLDGSAISVAAGVVLDDAGLNPVGPTLGGTLSLGVNAATISAGTLTVSNSNALHLADGSALNLTTAINGTAVLDANQAVTASGVLRTISPIYGTNATYGTLTLNNSGALGVMNSNNAVLNLGTVNVINAQTSNDVVFGPGLRWTIYPDFLSGLIKTATGTLTLIGETFNSDSANGTLVRINGTQTLNALSISSGFVVVNSSLVTGGNFLTAGGATLANGTLNLQTLTSDPGVSGPEPTSAVLLLLGGGLFGARRWRF